MIFPQYFFGRIKLFGPQQIIPSLSAFTIMTALSGISGSVAHSKQHEPSTQAVVTIPADGPLPDGVDAATGFRMQRYRSPVPQTLPGAEVVDTPRVIELLAAGDVVFIDVYPPTGLGPDPLQGFWVTNEQHSNIEGSVWLPEVGRGFIDSAHTDYFQRNLNQLTKGSTTPLLFYCTADCWQSWNAAKRAILWGHENVFWYPDGTDGWQDHNQPLVEAVPVNFLGE